MRRARCARWLSVLVLLAGVSVPALAQNQIFLCVDANGRKLLTDTQKGHCRALDVSDAIPAPPQRKMAPAPPRAPARSAPPTDFPTVDSATQKARDNDRRQILNDELRSEETRLAELKGEFKNGEPDRLGNERNYAKYQERVTGMRESIARSEQNIEALKRELAGIK